MTDKNEGLPQSAVHSGDADMREAVRLLTLWADLPGAEDLKPGHDTFAFLGKENSVGWVWAREVREERDFDKEQDRQRDLAMQCITEAESRAETARADTIEECAFFLEQSYPDHAWLNAACAAIRSLGARTSAQEAWMPIDTAPNHGEVLLWWKHAGVGVGYWDDEGDGWRCEGDECVPKNQSDCTHWMPKPAGPSVPSAHRGGEA